MLSLHSVHSSQFPLGIARSVLSSALRIQTSVPRHEGPSLVRFRHQLAPRKVTFVKQHKGVIPIPTGGSVKGTTLAYGDWGLRIKGEGVRLTAKQLMTAEEVIKRKIKPVKGAKVFLRVFPDIPVCVKVRPISRAYFLTRFSNAIQGNETRMGKGKGTFEYWATRCVVWPPFRGCLYAQSIPPGCQQDVSFLRLAVLQSVRSWPVMVRTVKLLLAPSSHLTLYAALRQAGNKLPTVMEFIDRQTPPRLGNLLLTSESKEGADSTFPPTSS
jgi:ribosomal protein L16/L10AE